MQSLLAGHPIFFMLLFSQKNGRRCRFWKNPRGHAMKYYNSFIKYKKANEENCTEQQWIFWHKNVNESCTCTTLTCWTLGHTAEMWADVHIFSQKLREFPMALNRLLSAALLFPQYWMIGWPHHVVGLKLHLTN